MSHLDEDFIKNIKVESFLNREGDILPYGYFSSESEGKVAWICDKDQNGKITSVFTYKGDQGTDRQIQYLETLEDAKKYRDILIENGWLKITPHQIEFTSPKTGKALNRKERRLAQRMLKHADNLSNPFIEKKKD